MNQSITNLMKKRYCLAVLVILFCLTIPSVFAEQDNIYIGLYVLGVDNYDVETGSYNADFYLDFKCRTNCTIEQFEAVNGHDLSYRRSIGGDGRPYYRVESSFVEPSASSSREKVPRSPVNWKSCGSCGTASLTTVIVPPGQKTRP